MAEKDTDGLLIDREHYKELAWQVREVARQAWFPFARKGLLRLAASFEYRARNLGRYESHIERTFTSAPRVSLVVVQSSSEEPPSQSAD